MKTQTGVTQESVVPLLLYNRPQVIPAQQRFEGGYLPVVTADVLCVTSPIRFTDDFNGPSNTRVYLWFSSYGIAVTRPTKVSTEVYLGLIKLHWVSCIIEYG